ncbi:MAG: O-antigen ligase family protein [Sphingomonadales bacterium]
MALLTGLAGMWAAMWGQYFVFLIPVAIAVLLFSIYKTEKFILLTGALAPLSINVNDIGGGLGLALPTEPLIIWIFCLLCVRLFLQGKAILTPLKHPIVLLVLGYVAWLWLSSVYSSMPLVSFKFSLARTWYIVVFFIGSIYLFRSMKNIHFFFSALVVCTLILVIYTLIQHARYGFIRSASYGISWPFFPDHGMYAAAIAFCVSILLFYTFNGAVFGIKPGWAPLLGFFLVVLLLGIVVSYTRATWLSLIAALGVYLLIRFRIKFYWIMLALLAVSAYGIINQDKLLYSLEANKQGSSDELEGHVKSVSNITTDPSNLERINRWKCAGRMVSERPLFGFGPGTFVFQYGPYQQSSEMTIISTNTGDLGDAHSEYFSAMSETGFPGMALWIGITLLTMAAAFRVIYDTEDRKIKITALMALLGLVTYHVHAFLNNYSQYDKIAVPLWTFTAVIVVLDLHRKEALNG